MSNLEHFAIMDIEYFHTPDTIIISSNTNNPCHLTCYYTDKKPLKHHTTRIVRGLEVPWGVYFCFVGWKAVEQNEHGDTLTHTFDIPDWSFCQIRWFTFRGTIAYLLSPSVGPIFKHHHSGPPIIETFIARTTDGDIRTSLLIRNYLSAHDGTNARVIDTSDDFGVGQEYAAFMYIIYRVGLFFDTFTIPLTAKILSATLSFRALAVYGVPYDIVIVSGDDLSEPLQIHHYHDLLDDIVSLGSTPRDWYKRLYDIDLNELGLTHITKRGLTKLALRTSLDIATTPPTAWEHTRIYSAESYYKPYLTITYQT